MLYVTTRSGRDVYTPAWTFRSDRAADGGFYIPYRMPQFEEHQLKALESMSMGQCIAMLLNKFCRCHLTAWDVERAIGKRPVRICGVGHRMMMAELWHDLGGSYDSLERHLAALVRGDYQPEQNVSSWLRIAIRVSVLFALYAGLAAIGEAEWDKIVDVAVPADDFSAVMSVAYARAMGLPVANIICGCTEQSGLWDFFRYGQLNTDAELPFELERLICAGGGWKCTEQFLNCCKQRRIYRPADWQLCQICADMHCCVISPQRIPMLQGSMLSANSRAIGTAAAMAYGALMDYRASTGEGRVAILLSEERP